MAGVRRRRRSSATEDNVTESETTSGSSVSERRSNDATGSSSAAVKSNPEVRPIGETLANEKSTALLSTFAGIALGLFFLYLGIATEVPTRDVAHAVMIDAGSTGTRAQVFSFRKGMLLETKMVSSSNRIVGLGYGAPAGDFFKPLLDEVRTFIPGTKRRSAVPLALRATAGLRQSGIEVSETALSEARKVLNSSGFLVKEEWVSILDEQSEAIGAWTSVNYLLGHLNGSVSKSSNVIELGGASLQIVFEASDDAATAVEEAQMVSGNTRAVQHLLPRIVSGQWGGRERKLVTFNRPGFGLVDFKKKLYLIFDQEGVLEEGNPCFRKGKQFEKKSLHIGVPGSEETRELSFIGDGDFERCVASAEIVFMQYGPLDKNVLNNIRGEIVAFAYMYDLTVKLGLSECPTKSELLALGKRLCEGDGSTADDRDELCAEYSYVYLLLRDITNNFSQDRQLRIVQFIDGHCLGWALGSVLTDFRAQLVSQLGRS